MAFERNKKLSNSARKFIRKEKARIRRNVFGLKEREKLISALYQKFSKDGNLKQKVSAAG